jgi:CRP-like cAMP-binding protein
MTASPGQLISERAARKVNPCPAIMAALETVLALVMQTADLATFISTYPSVLKLIEEQI